MQEVNLSNKDIDRIRKKYIGCGKEGNVYKVNKDYLYKIYTIELENNYLLNNSYKQDYMLDSDGTKVIKSYKNCLHNVKEVSPYYIDIHGVKRIYDESVVNKAIERQKYVKLTSLPLAPIFVNKRFKGCVLKYHKGYTDIHNLAFLPYKVKLKILKQLLEKLKELNDNYIYPIEISNYKTDINTHSNILINPFTLNTEIIDLDAKSTIYTDSYNKYLSILSYYKYTSLAIKLLIDVDIEIDDSQDFSEDDVLFLKKI